MILNGWIKQFKRGELFNKELITMIVTNI